MVKIINKFLIKNAFLPFFSDLIRNSKLYILYKYLNYTIYEIYIYNRDFCKELNHKIFYKALIIIINIINY